MTYKVVNDFGNARKGDLFTNSDCEDIFTMERTEGSDNVSEDSESYFSTYVSMELSKAMIDSYCKKGYLELVKEEDNKEDKLEDVYNTIVDMIDTYTKDYNTLIEDYNNGDVQPCVKVEAETVYHNLIKVLNYLKSKIDE